MIATVVNRPTAGSVSRRDRPLPHVVVVLLVIAAGAVVLSCSHESPAQYRVVAQAVATASDRQMLSLEALLVGADAVADPATGRLPNVGAFHRAGIETLTIEGTRLTVSMLRTASREQRETVRATLARSPLVVSVGVDRI